MEFLGSFIECCCRRSVDMNPKPLKFDRTSSPIQITEQDMIDALVKAGYIIKKMDKGGGSGGGFSTPLS
jgi:hypothetical protein